MPADIRVRVSCCRTSKKLTKWGFQARLGHSSPSFTLSVYSHVTPGMDKEAADAYTEAMTG